MGKHNRGQTGAAPEPDRSRQVIVSELTDNPLATWSQFLHELDAGRANAGRIAVKRNLTTLCGGFALFHGDDAQRRAAARFRSLYEQAQIGGAKAVDPSIEHVDGGGINPEATFERGADARKAFNAMYQHLGRLDYRRAEYVIIGEHGPTAYAKFRIGAHPGHGRVISKYQVEMRAIMDKLAKLWGMAS